MVIIYSDLKHIQKYNLIYTMKGMILRNEIRTKRKTVIIF